MFANGVIFVLFLVGVNCRYILVEDPVFLSGEELDHLRARRDIQATVSVDDKGNLALDKKAPLGGNDENRLSQTASSTWNADGKMTSYGVGMALDNINGHGASLSARQIPDFGKQLTAAGRVNLVNNDKHNLDANAFITRTLPNSPDIPNFSTVGGNLDYMYKQKIGANLGASHTDFLQKTDVSALGKLNLYRDPVSSFDFNAGAQRSFSPFIPNSRWEPTFGFSYSRSF